MWIIDSLRREECGDVSGGLFGGRWRGGGDEASRILIRTRDMRYERAVRVANRSACERKSTTAH